MIKDIIQNNIISPTMNSASQNLVTGLVLGSDSANNVCSIRYTNKTGNICNKENVPIRLYGNGTDWFPTTGEMVLVEDNGSTCTVIARYVGNYSMDVRSKLQLRQDVQSDDSGCQMPGGVIM